MSEVGDVMAEMHALIDRWRAEMPPSERAMHDWRVWIGTQIVLYGQVDMDAAREKLLELAAASVELSTKADE